MIDRRIQWLFFACLLVLGMILVRLIHLQVFMGYEFARQAFRSHYRRVKIQSPRGSIWDRHQRLLAVSLVSDSLCADPRMVENAESLATFLAANLPGSEDDYFDKLNRSDRRFTWIHRNMTPSQSETIRNINAKGLYFRRENQRFYPAGSEAASLIGFTGVDGTGLEGLESVYDKMLGGLPGEEVVAYDALARPYSSDPIVISPPTPGQDIHLTLDKTIQYFAMAELKKIIKEESALWGAVLVMDVHNGDILAMASEPSFNPHQFHKALPESRRNRCISQLIEPGSTFKAVTLASVIEAGQIEAGETIDCENGQITIGNHTFSDWKNFQKLTVEDIIVFSSNVGTIKLAQRIGGSILSQFAHNVGFGSAVLDGIPGSESGYVRKVDSWSPTATASLSIGYGVAVTPLQLAVVYSSFANGGFRVQPRLLSNSPQTDPVRIMKAHTAKQVSDILQQTVSRGTAKSAAPRRYSAAGKTGTARRYDHDKAAYDPNRVTCVFSGFAPAESPRISVCVVIDDPQKQKWASQVTATLFSRVVDKTLLYLGEPPQRKVAV